MVYVLGRRGGQQNHTVNQQAQYQIDNIDNQDYPDLPYIIVQKIRILVSEIGKLDFGDRGNCCTSLQNMLALFKLILPVSKLLEIYIDM